MSGPGFDAVIAGGGLSGLSLAARLAAGPWRDRRVLLVDDDTLPAAQSWAFWTRTRTRARPGAESASVPGLGAELTSVPGLGAIVSASYDRVRIHADGTARLLPLGRYRYQVVRRPDLRRAVLGLLAERPGFEVHTGRVEAVRDGAGCAETIVNGRVIRSRWAFDSVSHRPPSATGEVDAEPAERAVRAEPTGQAGQAGRAGRAERWPVDGRLAFTGWEVRCPRPVFDPATPSLFDFRTAQQGGSRFVYVLPTDPYRALVELTSFVPRRAVPPDHRARDAALVTYLRDVLDCTEYEIVRGEAAVLPLRCFPPPRRHGRVLTIGAAGGLVKASTGYAFQRVQRDSAAIADSLVRHGHPFRLPPRSRWYGALDAVLLDVLDHEPARLEQAFARLFAANPAERVLRFLDEESTPLDEVRLITALPPPPYLRAVARRAGLAARAAARRAGRRAGQSSHGSRGSSRSQGRQGSSRSQDSSSSGDSGWSGGSRPVPPAGWR